MRWWRLTSGLSCGHYLIQSGSELLQILPTNPVSNMLVEGGREGGREREGRKGDRVGRDGDRVGRDGVSERWRGGREGGKEGGEVEE